MISEFGVRGVGGKSLPRFYQWGTETYLNIMNVDIRIGHQYGFLGSWLFCVACLRLFSYLCHYPCPSFPLGLSFKLTPNILLLISHFQIHTKNISSSPLLLRITTACLIPRYQSIFPTDCPMSLMGGAV